MSRRLSFAVVLLALAISGHASAQNPGNGATPGTSRNFELVGHEPLFNRGMNAAIAVYHNYVYVGNRADVTTQPVHPGILVVDTSRPAQPTVVGEIPPPPIGQTTRELRVWPQQNLLIVMRFRCSPFTHGCPASPPVWSVDFYDVSGLNARDPKLLTSYVPSRQPHEMFLWLDPNRPGRALLYMSTPTSSADPTRPNLIVTDISRARQGIFTEIVHFNANPLFTAEQRETLDVALHSMSVSDDGTRTYLAYLGGGFFVLDTSQLANAVPSPQVQLLTPVPNTPRWPNQTVHSAIPLPGRPYALTTDELYGDKFNFPGSENVHGCPWGWSHVIDVSDPANPRLVGEYRTEANTAAFCSTPLGQDDFAASHTAHNPTVYSDLAFISWHGSGLQAFSVANPASPTQTGWFTPTPLPSVAREDPSLTSTGNKVAVWSFPIVKNGLVYVADIRNGLYVLRYTGTGAAKVDRTIFLEGNSNLSESCPVATVRPKRIVAGRRTTVTVSVSLFAQPVDRASVRLAGAGLRRVATTDVSGTVALRIRPTRAGTIRVRVPNVAKHCVATMRVRPAPRVRPTPPLTGRPS